MSTYQDLLDSVKDGKQLFEVRLQLIRKIEEHTARKLIVYAADDRKPLNSIEAEDLIGFADLLKGIEGWPIDILLNSPGGSAEATEQIVNFLRSNSNYIRFIVPYMAMSAATLMCLAGNEILLDDRSSLGPIDPQIRIPSPRGSQVIYEWFPAQMIIDGYEKASEEIQKDQRALPIFLPWLTNFGPYVEICRNALKLSEELATKWLKSYMFAHDSRGRRKVKKIVAYLLDHNLHKSHGRRLKIADAVKVGLQITDLRYDSQLRDLIWQLWCAIHFLFEKSPKTKIFENAYGVNWGRDVIVQQVAVPGSPSQPVPPPASP
jgi:hypothetical protein